LVREDAASRLDRQLFEGILEDAAPAVPEADHPVFVGVDGLAHHGPDDRIEPGAVTTAGEHADPHAAESYARELTGSL
jgi:hypothetical protein